jgi:hypothetical protein
MVCHIENQVIGQHETLLNAVVTAALHPATSALDSPTPPVPPGFALGEGEDRGDETRASLIHFIDSVLDLMKDDDFL